MDNWVSEWTLEWYNSSQISHKEVLQNCQKLILFYARLYVKTLWYTEWRIRFHRLWRVMWHHSREKQRMRRELQVSTPATSQCYMSRCLFTQSGLFLGQSSAPGNHTYNMCQWAEVGRPIRNQDQWTGRCWTCLWKKEDQTFWVLALFISCSVFLSRIEKKVVFSAPPSGHFVK